MHSRADDPPLQLVERRGVLDSAAVDRRTDSASPLDRCLRALRQPDWPRLAAVALVLGLADWGSQLAGDSVFPGGPLDETAHLATTVLVLWALGRRVGSRLWLPALIASVAIDVDHIPGQLGVDWLTAGTPRPYTHSLTTVLVALLLSAAWPRRRDVFRGVALGLTIHLFRDLAEHGSGVALLWPLSDQPSACRTGCIWRR